MNEKGQVYFQDKLSGTISKKEDGSFEFIYEDKAPAVSLTLPTTQKRYKSEDLFPFFDGLIPEGWLLNLTQKNWKIPKNDRMTLLLTTCQDCIGAVHVHQENMEHEETRPGKLAKKEGQHRFESAQCLICMEALEAPEDLYHKKCAKNLFGFTHAPIINIAEDDFEQLALLQINQRLTLTGVQRKLSLTTEISNKKERLTLVGFDGRFILKPSSAEFPEMAQLEHLCMKLAKIQKIPVAECGLVYLTDGQLAYITKRFDRMEGQKIPMEDFCQLSGKTTDKKYTGSAEALGKVIDQFSAFPQDDKLTLFQILLFSFWTGNSDMHLKNFSLWKDPKSGAIRLSPCYDLINTRLLISAKDDPEELALPINAKKNKLKWADFLALGKCYKLPEKVLEGIKEKMLDSIFETQNLIFKSFLSEEKKDEFLNLLEERSHRLM